MINKMMRSRLNLVCAMAMAAALALTGCSGELAENLKSSVLGSETKGVTVEGNDSSALESSAESSVVLGDVNAAVTLSDDGTSVDGSGVTVDGSDVIIEQGGTYSFTGTLTEGRIKVEAEGQDVQIILNGVTITNSDKDAIYIEEANSAVVYVMEGTVNNLTSGTEETYETAKAAVEEANSSDDSESSGETTESEASESQSTEASSDANSENSDEASSDSETTDDGFSNSQKATIMAKCDLMISGAGTLNVYGYINNGIQSKTNLTVECVNLVMVAANDGIKGGTDVTIMSGVFDLKSVGDAVQSDGTLNIEDGTFTVVTGDGAAFAEKKSEMGFGGGNGGFGGGRMNRQNSTTESGTDSSTTTQTSSQTASASGQM
ncbi:MAG: carbohydrate-binding domain-containing protein, partial [Butyrivibrio sp.]|nr:carbohydrate-binding domain-containing protein [Butyrivibrio sp.]